MKNKVLKALADAEDNYISGEQISIGLHVSRAAVWKAVKSLRSEGCVILSAPNRGYKLISCTLYYPEVLKKKFNTTWLGQSLICLDSVDSTNKYLRMAAEGDLPHGTVVISDCQGSGRGRLTRGWHSPAGYGIYASLLFRPEWLPAAAPRITPIIAVGVCRGIQNAAGLNCKIKWPNDIVVNGKKLCGILAEMSAGPESIRHLVVGIGINVSNENFPDEIADTATSITMEGSSVDRDSVFAAILKEIEKEYESYSENEDFEIVLDNYRHYSITIGMEVRVEEPKRTYLGRAVDIDTEGRLIVDTNGELNTVSAGDVSIRGIGGYV